MTRCVGLGSLSRKKSLGVFGFQMDMEPLLIWVRSKAGPAQPRTIFHALHQTFDDLRSFEALKRCVQSDGRTPDIEYIMHLYNIFICIC